MTDSIDHVYFKNTMISAPHVLCCKRMKLISNMKYGIKWKIIEWDCRQPEERKTLTLSLVYDKNRWLHPVSFILQIFPALSSTGGSYTIKTNIWYHHLIHYNTFFSLSIIIGAFVKVFDARPTDNPAGKHN